MFQTRWYVYQAKKNIMFNCLENVKMHIEGHYFHGEVWLILNVVFFYFRGYAWEHPTNPHSNIPGWKRTRFDYWWGQQAFLGNLRIIVFDCLVRACKVLENRQSYTSQVLYTVEAWLFGQIKNGPVSGRLASTSSKT